MSTRGLMGIKKKGELKSQYNHFDSYVSGLGKYIIETINDIPKEKRIKKLSDTFDNIVLVDNNTKPTKELINYCIENNVVNLIVSNRTVEDLYCLLHETQGELSLYLNGFKYMLNGNDFINDTLFCEYAYVINLDTNTLDITFGWENRITKSYDLLNLDYEEIEREIAKLESEV